MAYQELLDELKGLREEGLLDEGTFAREVALVRRMLEGEKEERGGEVGADLFETGVVGVAREVPTPGDWATGGGLPPTVGLPEGESVLLPGDGAGRLLPGAVLAGRYRVMALLGLGGMGQVYLVFDAERQRPIALKRLHRGRDEAGMERRIRRELGINEKLTHPGIVRTYSLQRDREHGLLLTMEYVPGKSLATILVDRTGWQEEQGEPAWGLSLLEQVAQAVDFAHARGVIHRDLKPANILVTPTAEAKLLDFGVALELHETGGKSQEIAGSAYYMAPEQLAGEPVSAATDQYALGVVAFQWLTGHVPQPGMPGPSALNEALDSAVDAVIERALHWQPTQRYPSCRAFVQALHGVWEPQPRGGQSSSSAKVIALATQTRSTKSTNKGAPKARTRNENHAKAKGRDTRGREIGENAHVTDVSAHEVAGGQVISLSGERGAAWQRLRKRIDRKRPSWLEEKLPRQVPHVLEGDQAHRAAQEAQTQGWWPVLPPLGKDIGLRVLLSQEGKPLLPCVYVPQGTFWMGADADDAEASPHEAPQREVELQAFWIGRTPITNWAWWIFVQESGFQPSAADKGAYYLRHWKASAPQEALWHRPVVWLTYRAAWAFCDFYGLSLPSEAQWEKAARGTDKRRYPWGEQKPDRNRCNFARLEGGVTPVGHYLYGSSPFGALDCAGNVYEWCADAWVPRYHESTETQDPVTIASADRRVTLRGGNYNTPASALRTSHRYGVRMQQSASHTSFRPTLDLRKA